MTIDDSARKLKSYRKRREVEVAMQSAKEKVQFLQKYPEWDEIKAILRPSDREIIEAVHGLNGLVISFQKLAEERNVSRQAVFDAHKKALVRLDKARKSTTSTRQIPYPLTTIPSPQREGISQK